MERKPRYHLLDLLRGITLLSMAGYHACWNLDNLFGKIDFSYSYLWVELWQQSICWTFILLSGFCWSLSRKNLVRGLVTLGGAVIISVVTHFAMPQAAISFGVLCFIGSAMVLLIPLRGLLEKIPAAAGLAGSFALFLLLKKVGDGSVILFGKELFSLPAAWYQNDLTAYLGFPPPGFASGDYFPLLPWLFLYLTGYFLYRLFLEKNLLQLLTGPGIKPLNFLGRHSLPVYLLHQPLIYGVMMLVF